jgi:hypothetical protein
MGEQPDDPREHPWWQHVPKQQKPQALWRRQRNRVLLLVSSRPSRLIFILGVYLGIIVVIALSGAGAVSLLVLLPLLLLPALAGVAWWLTWTEYHQ